MSVNKKNARIYRKQRIRKKIQGTPERPRLSIYRSVKHFYAQIINDIDGCTLIGLSTHSKDFGGGKEAGNVKGAKEFGKKLAAKAKEKQISKVVFDRSGYIYHGRIKAFAEGAREGGLEF